MLLSRCDSLGVQSILKQESVVLLFSVRPFDKAMTVEYALDKLQKSSRNLKRLFICLFLFTMAQELPFTPISESWFENADRGHTRLGNRH